ncbi:MAG: glycoside hydrolase, partial [Kiritimatiellae bacterium]|nr:glycoside hydrolase [Kiritimatiellia bacterium]
WFECYHPDHPMTRSQSRHYKMELLKLVSEEFGMVCGSETGHEAAVPYCDYFEGMLSLGPYRVPDSGRDMLRVWDEVPENLGKYQVGEAYRLPLWELVYHDCVVAQWYWGDYNNKLPAVWRKRDLFNALYGTPPMYMFTLRGWREQKERFVESYKTAATVAHLTGYHEMVDHRMLTSDRSVQQTFFANGVRVTVNFGDKPYAAEGGKILAPLDLLVEQSEL